MNNSYLRSSNNYIWNVNNVLGKGATGAVYNGVNKNTGEAVAVKCFNHLSQMRPYEVQKREFEVLKKVNHQNIVKLLAIEEENDSKHKVLIMELCTGGSLFNILDDPINCHGLEEKEFLNVLKHLSAGMKHLRDNNIIHRDLKPGNIMKYVGEDGISIYKLTDFGAARELEDDQQFMSLYGTEEYLHPDMYERAVLRKSAGKSFHANVDLWSIGVTLFHIATGSLPFRPFGGRKNKETMFKITTEKQSGIISGIQHSENGEIEWSRTLPKTCLLSPALQALVTPLLAGLMECDSHKMWSFDKFFDTVTYILSHKIYHIFYINHLTDVVIYLLPQENLTDLKHQIESIVNIPPKSQLLLFNKKQILDLTDVNTTEENPIILLNSDTTKMKSNLVMSTHNPKFPDLQIQVTNCDQDAQLAKLCASIAYSIQRIVNKCVLYYKLTNSIPSHVICLIESNVRLLLEKQQACSLLFNSLQHQLHYINDTNIFLQEFSAGAKNELKNSYINDAQRLYKNLEDYWNSLLPKMSYMNDKAKRLQDTWMNPWQDKEFTPLADSAMNTAAAKAKHYCHKIRESWQTLHKDKNSRLLSSNEEQLHQLEKIKIDNNCKKLNDLLCKACYPALNDIMEKLEDWYTGAQVAIVQAECLFKELIIFMNDCEELQSCFAKVKEEQKNIWKKGFLSPRKTDEVNEKANRIKSSSRIPAPLKQELDYFRASQDKLWGAMQEHQSLVAEFESLSVEQQQS
ncbi:serine/threonine-protein kinase TBK1-like protein [Dinothrombium tinctorium]|uniref:Serine/threonine-protein kinase TBK1-like protein n=1 Tax=Dinothrombium tinctorium TaxID=1965070 RepID=A0A3S3NFL8_9ACAR|nr:serine/threonine-protein kinase TBK1-like protein [Dinothrombium tinctorium]